MSFLQRYENEKKDSRLIYFTIKDNFSLWKIHYKDKICIDNCLIVMLDRKLEYIKITIIQIWFYFQTTKKNLIIKERIKYPRCTLYYVLTNFIICIQKWKSYSWISHN